MEFTGRYFAGTGDVQYLRLLNDSRRFFAPDPEIENLSMLYISTWHGRSWDGFQEGLAWDAWWIQNSYGATYSALPFLEEPYLTFLQHSQDLWFNQMGNGKHIGAAPPFNWVAPNGSLCDCAQPGRIIYKQGDGRIQIHDWPMEMTAAGIVMQAELLLISRDRQAIAHYLPLLERSANFIETRRNPTNNLFLAGPAGNLLAPSYAGWKRPDGTYGKAYLTGLSVTYIAALDRLIQLEKLAGRAGKAHLYTAWRDDALKGLPRLTTGKGYFIRSLDPDGTRHGVYGASVHGYFETSPNIDAIAFHVVNHAKARLIYREIASLPDLRPFGFILANYPSYDDMSTPAKGLWAYGNWVNGGAWPTVEARAILAYYRLGHFAEARRSVQRLFSFARRFCLTEHYTHLGTEPATEPNNPPIHLDYDDFGPFAAFIRGLFEYRYAAKGLTLIPHIPSSITELVQRFPIRFGRKQLYLATVGAGPITGVRINRKSWGQFDGKTVFLPYTKDFPAVAHIQILRGGAKAVAIAWPRLTFALPAIPVNQLDAAGYTNLARRVTPLKKFCRKMQAAGWSDRYEAAHARLALSCIATVLKRRQLLESGKLKALPRRSEAAADKLYKNTAINLCDGLVTILRKDAQSTNAYQLKVASMWSAKVGGHHG